MFILKHLKTLQHVSIIIQIIFRELVCSLLKLLKLDCSPAYLSTQNARTHTKWYAAASPHLLFTFSTSFKISDYNQEHTSSTKMIWMMIETCWSVFKCFNMNILD